MFVANCVSDCSFLETTLQCSATRRGKNTSVETDSLSASLLSSALEEDKIEHGDAISGELHKIGLLIRPLLPLPNAPPPLRRRLGVLKLLLVVNLFRELAGSNNPNFK